MKKNLQFMMALCFAMIGTQTYLLGYTDAEVKAFTTAQVQALTSVQIQSLTPGQLLLVMPNLKASGWCDNNLEYKPAKNGSPGLCGNQASSNNSQYRAIVDAQILGLSRAQLLTIPMNLYLNIGINRIVYALAHNS